MTPENFKAWRRKMTLSQRAAANALGVALSTLQTWERGTAFATGKPVEIDRRTALACAALAAGIETESAWADAPTVDNGMRPVHPGEVLREDYLVPLGSEIEGLDADLQAVARENAPVTSEMAQKIVDRFGGDVKSWLQLQRMYDMRKEDTDAS